MKCIECIHADLQANPKMARHGFCICKAQPAVGKSESLTHPRNCSSFSPALPTAIAKRTAWLNTQFPTHKGSQHAQ